MSYRRDEPKTYAEHGSRRRDVKALEDRWMELAYAAEAAGNFNRYNYYMAWVVRAHKYLPD